jgi:hypothetical protein
MFMRIVRAKPAYRLFLVLVGLVGCVTPPPVSTNSSDASTPALAPYLPREIYLQVLDSVAVRARSARQPVFLDTSTLPTSITRVDLRRRGFRPRDQSYRCGVHSSVSLRPVDYEEAGFFKGLPRITVVEWLLPQQGMASDYHYLIRCDAGTCKVVAAERGLGDLVTGCPASR